MHFFELTFAALPSSNFLSIRPKPASYRLYHVTIASRNPALVYCSMAIPLRSALPIYKPSLMIHLNPIWLIPVSIICG